MTTGASSRRSSMAGFVVTLAGLATACSPVGPSGRPAGTHTDGPTLAPTSGAPSESASTRPVPPSGTPAGHAAPDLEARLRSALGSDARIVSFIGIPAHSAAGVGVDPATTRWAVAGGSGAGADNRWSVIVTEVPGGKADAFLGAYLEAQRATASIAPGRVGDLVVHSLTYPGLPERWAFILGDLVLVVEAPDATAGADLIERLRRSIASQRQ